MEGEGGKERGTRALSFTAGETQWGAANSGETQWGSAGGLVRLAEGADGQESRGLAEPERQPAGGTRLNFTG